MSTLSTSSSKSGLSLTSKLTIAATALCVLCVAATSTVMGWRTSSMAHEQADEQARLAAREAAGVVANDLDGRDAEFAGKGPAYDATGRYIAYWNRGSGQVAVEPLVDYEKAGANDWYDIPRRSGKDALIEPYIYAVAGKDVLMATIASPVIVDGRFVGMAGSDLPLQGLSERVGKMSPMPGARVSLLSAGGLYVAVHEPERLAKKADDLPPEAMAHIAQGKPYRYEDGQGWVHLFEPVVA